MAGLGKKQAEEVAAMLSEALAPIMGALGVSNTPEAPVTSPSVVSGDLATPMLAVTEAQKEAAKPKEKRIRQRNPMLAGVMRFQHPKQKDYSVVVFVDKDNRRFQFGAMAEGDVRGKELAKEILGAVYVNPLTNKEWSITLRHNLKSMWGADKVWEQTRVGPVPKQEMSWEQFNEVQPLVAAA